MSFKHPLTFVFLVCTLSVVCFARTHKREFQFSPTSVSINQERSQKWSPLFSRTKEFLWGSRKSGKYLLVLSLIQEIHDFWSVHIFIIIGDYRVYQKHDRTRRGGSGTKSLTVRHDAIERITEIILEVTSENDDVSARVIKGGVGKDKVTIEVTGRDTSYLEYNVEIYGKPWRFFDVSIMFLEYFEMFYY